MFDLLEHSIHKKLTSRNIRKLLLSDLTNKIKMDVDNMEPRKCCNLARNTHYRYRAEWNMSQLDDPNQIDPICCAMSELMSRMHPAMCRPPSHLNTCDDKFCMMAYFASCIYELSHNNHRRIQTNKRTRREKNEREKSKNEHIHTHTQTR